MSSQDAPSRPSLGSSSNISDSTLLKLAESMQQQSASLLTTVNPPEFRGSINEDFEEWLREFKQSTLTFNDNLRCLALQKALFGAARNWLKTDTEAKKAIATGQWKTIKNLLKNRWLKPNRDELNHERLSQLRFDSKKDALTSFVELYYNCFKKAHKNASDNDIIMGLKMKLPNNMIRYLNLLNDNWSETQDIAEIYKLTRKVEANILPYEDKDSSLDKPDINTLVATIKELKDTMTKNAKETEAVIAAIRQEKRPSGRGPYPEKNESEQFKRTSSGDYRGRSGILPAMGNRSVEEYTYKRPRYDDARRGYANGEYNQIQQAYWQKHGRPPGPCQVCREGYHFNKHCPFKNALN